ncbi:nSTAND1 domain-containing NTPase [Streptomyces sp. O3]
MTPLTPGTVEGTGPKALDAAVLRIRTAQGEPVGLAFLVTTELALTCAHVVSAALGTPEDAVPATSARLHVDLPLLPASGPGGQGVTASVEHWVPAQSSGTGDVAVLRLSASLPGGRPIRLAEAQDVWGHPARAFGFPTGRAGGVWHSGVLRARQANGWVQADLAENGYRVSRGFSGSPVWDEKLVGVVGMVAVAEVDEPPVSYLIPTDGLLEAWPELRGLALPPSPFRGLSAFREADAPVFHGRRTETDELVGMLPGAQWTTVVGPSGAGKSSLAMAGVLPRLREAGTSAVVMRPGSGSSPLSALAAALLPLLEPETSATQRLERIPALVGRLAADNGLADVVPPLLDRHRSRQLLIVVDQFEELLALAPAAVDELAGVLFGDTLPGTVRVLTTLRADFLEAALAHPRLGRALSRQVYALGPMGPEGLRDIITVPVDDVPGVSYEPHLVDRILADIGSDAGALALLGFTLDLLWQRQSGGLLTHQAYEELGGVTGALGDHADQVWTEYVPAADEAAARRLFTQLIRVPIGAAAATLRTVPCSELGADEWRVAQRLAATRLLVTGRSAEGVETVELAHEALISGWGKLRGWAEEDRSFLAWRETLRHDMDRWERGERATELLPTDLALAGAQRWLRERGTDLSEAERDYLERGRRHRRSRTRRRRAFVSGLAIVIALALVFGGLWLYARGQSQEREAIANSRALTQAAQNEELYDPAQSVLLAIAAYQASPTQEARNELLRKYVTHGSSARVLSGVPGNIRWLVASRDGDVLVAQDRLGGLMVFVHAAKGRVRSEMVAQNVKVQDVMVSGDGRRAGFVALDGTVSWFDVNADAEQIAGPVHKLPKVRGVGPRSQGGRAAFSTDGRMIAARAMNAKGKGRLVWWNLDDGTVGGALPSPPSLEPVIWFGPDNRSLLMNEPQPENGTTTKDPEQYKWRLVSVDLDTGASRTVVKDSNAPLLVSGDRTGAVACHHQSGKSDYILHRVADGTPQGRPYRDEGGFDCNMAATDEKGHRIALSRTRSGSTTLHLVDLDRGALVTRAVPRPSDIPLEELVSIGGKLHAVGYSGMSIAYTAFSPSPGILDVGKQVLTHDGSKTITVLRDGSQLQLRSVSSDRLLAEVPRPKPYWDGGKSPIRLSHNGRTFASRQGRNTVSVREVSTFRETARISTAKPPEPDLDDPKRDPKWTGFDYFFDRAGYLVTVSGTRVQQWDPSTGAMRAHFDAEVFRPKTTGDVPKLAVSSYPEANHVAVLVADDPVVRIVDLTTGRTASTVKTVDDAQNIQFDDTGRYFALTRDADAVELWRRDPLRKEMGPLRGVAMDSRKAVTPSEFLGGAGRFLDHEGRFVMAANSTVQTYDIEEHRYLDFYNFGRVASSSSSSWYPYSFVDVSKDGRTVIYADERGNGAPLTLDPIQWQRELCRTIAYRTFTTDVQDRLPLQVSARSVCPDP